MDSEERRYYDPELVDGRCPHNSDCNDCSAFIGKICTLSFKEYDGDYSDEEWFGSDYEDYYSIDSLLEQESEDRISGY